jgi:hypothetical protein
MAFLKFLAELLAPGSKACEMRKAMLAFALATLSAAIASCRSSTPGFLLDQKVVVNGITATVTMYDRGTGIISVTGEFESSWYPVECLSLYRDMRYELRASDNRIIPMNEQTWQHPPDDAVFGSMNHVVRNRPGHRQTYQYDCGYIVPPLYHSTTLSAAASYPLLPTLYAHLPPDEYTLHMSFAPHGIVEQADFAPVRISITPSPRAT